MVDFEVYSVSLLVQGLCENIGDGDIPPMLPASYGSPLDTSPVLPETGSGDCCPQMAREAALVMLLMVSMVAIFGECRASRYCVLLCDQVSIDCSWK